MSNHTYIFFTCLVFLLFRIATPAFALESSGIKTKITAGLGIEYLKYEEQLGGTSLKSDANVSNIVIRVEGIKRWANFFIGFDGVTPVVSYDRQEEWSVNGTRDQTNSLSYELTQFAAFAGFPVAPYFNPYIGLRSAWSDQKRSDFRDHSGSILSSSKITEKVDAHFFSLGFRGNMPISTKGGVAYGAEYNLPFYTEVTNNGLPGWKAKDIDGYLWRVYSELLYVLKDNMSYSLLICAGQQHWDGSDWQVYNNSKIKWPENDTYFFNAFLNVTWSF